MTEQLLDKTIFITGASSGFGRAIALACAQAGADVALLARREDALHALAGEVEGLGRRALVCPADLADEDQVRRAVAQALAAFGHVDVLVNNAGTNVKKRSLTECSPADWRHILEVNLTSAFVCTQLVLPGMIARQQGTIINIGSLAGVRMSTMPPR
jgi:NADP-dependent 3-hydroxy acid dehydrogenase YdfG